MNPETSQWNIIPLLGEPLYYERNLGQWTSLHFTYTQTHTHRPVYGINYGKNMTIDLQKFPL